MAADVFDRLAESLKKGLREVVGGQEKLEQQLLEVKSLQLRAASETRHASSISEQDLAYVEGILGIRWALLDEDATGGAAEPPDDPDFEWNTAEHEAKQKVAYMEALEGAVRAPPYMQWSQRVDKSDLLRTCPGTGGATDLPFTIGCRTDALIILSHAPFGPEAKIVATVELKKRVVLQSVRQAKTTFICASLHSMMPVVSILTDMERGHAAFYCSGLEPKTGRQICVQQVFKTYAAMCNFLHTALSSVPKDALQFRGGSMTSVVELQHPKRKLLQQPREPSHSSLKAAMAVLAAHATGGNDVARLGDLASFDDQGLDEGACHLSYFS